jgi:hypothetical protein
MKAIWDKIPILWRIPALLFLAVLVFVGTSYIWAGAWNSVGNWWYHHSENKAKQEIQQLKTEVAAETKAANEAVAAYESSKWQIAEEKKKRVLAESILADKTKNTDQKLAAYEAAVNAVPTVTTGESDAELCQRARSLGISVRCD